MGKREEERGRGGKGGKGKGGREKRKQCLSLEYIYFFKKKSPVLALLLTYSPPQFKKAFDETEAPSDYGQTIILKVR